MLSSPGLRHWTELASSWYAFSIHSLPRKWSQVVFACLPGRCRDAAAQRYSSSLRRSGRASSLPVSEWRIYLSREVVCLQLFCEPHRIYQSWIAHSLAICSTSSEGIWELSSVSFQTSHSSSPSKQVQLSFQTPFFLLRLPLSSLLLWASELARSIPQQ